VNREVSEVPGEGTERERKRKGERGATTCSKVSLTFGMSVSSLGLSRACTCRIVLHLSLSRTHESACEGSDPRGV